MNSIRIALLPLLLLCALATNARAQGDGCPNVRATQVPAHVDHQGSPYERCGLGVQIFGLPIRIGGAKCYRHEYLYPAHQECLGAANAGTFCEPESSMPVEHYTCECLWISVFGTGVGLPKCNCTYAGTAGTVQDALTGLCHVSP